MAIYKEFQEIFDGFMEEFCEAEGVDSTEFMQKMQESETSDPRAAHYISIIIASMEYDAFVKLMRQMRRRATVVQQQQQRAEAKDGDGGGAAAPRGGAKDGGAKGGAGGAAGAVAAEAKAEAKGDDGAKPGGVKDDDAPMAGGSAK